jgi:hypothetical protein
MNPPWNTYPGLHGERCSESQLKCTGPLAQAVFYSGAGFWQGRNLGSLPLRIEMKVSRGKLWVHIGASSVRQTLKAPSWRQIITNSTGTILMSLLMDNQLWSSQGDKYSMVHGMQIVVWKIFNGSCRMQIWVIGNLCSRFDVFLQQGWSDLDKKDLRVGCGEHPCHILHCICDGLMHDLSDCLLQ